MGSKLFAVCLVLVFHGQPAEVICAGCHPKETAAFSRSSMGQSLGVPVRTVPSGEVKASESGSVIRISWANGRMTHRLAELGFSADYPIDYQIGAGTVGHSYIATIGSYLLQSPASYYRRYGWDVSPGFKDASVLDFDRVLSGECLFCHSSNPNFTQRRKLQADAKVEAIDCARCHGDARAHVNRPSRANIVNPGALAARARDSVCEQCHLEGVARVLNPGKTWRDFKAGTELEATMSVYVDDQRRPGAKVVSQVEQLALSRCARESGGKLWCGTCHDPHGLRTANRATELAAICGSCHSSLSPANHARSAADCTGCHMPRLRPNDVAHAASTDHRILRNPAKDESVGSAASIRAWRQPGIEVQQRNLGLAELEASALPGLQTAGYEGERLLENLPTEQRDGDPVVLAALGGAALSRSSAEQGESLLRRAGQLDSLNGDYAMLLGIALKQKGDFTGAAKALQDAIDKDASLQRAYLELSALFAKQGKLGEARTVLRAYLRWNPRSILVRSTLDSLQ